MLTANRPKEYKKGPDVGSKSAQSKICYKSLLKNQKTLKDLGFTKPLNKYMLFFEPKNLAFSNRSWEKLRRCLFQHLLKFGAQF